MEPKIGQWDKVNAFVVSASGGKIERMSQYSMIVDPMTSCGCFECIAAILPMTGGIMIVNREFPEMTPSGMKFSTLAGTVGGGQQMPGFIGHSKYYIGSKKFIAAEGGIRRIVWMPTVLKQEIHDVFVKRAEELGLGRRGVPGQDRRRDERHDRRASPGVHYQRGPSRHDDGPDVLTKV